MTNNTTLDHLSELDAAPRVPLAAHEIARRDALLSDILSSPEPTDIPKPKRSFARAWKVALPSALAVGVIVAGGGLVAHGLLGGTPGTVPASAGPLSTVSLASWTGQPKQLQLTSKAGVAAKDWCLGSMGNAPAASSQPTITNADERGDVASMIVRRGGYAMLCIVGSDKAGFWEVDGSPSDPTPTIGADGITAESSGSHGVGASGITYVEGVVGSDVRGITVTDSGKTFAATVQDGRWAAWWPTPNPHGGLTGSVTITTTNGTSHTVSGDSLPQN